MGKQHVVTKALSCRRWSCEIYLVEPLSHQQWEREVTMACSRFCSSAITFHVQELLWLGRPLTRLLVLLLFQVWHRNESLWCLGWWWAFPGFWFWCKKLLRFLFFSAVAVSGSATAGWLVLAPAWLCLLQVAEGLLACTAAGLAGRTSFLQARDWEKHYRKKENPMFLRK